MNAKELAELLERLDKWHERIPASHTIYSDAAAAIRSLIVELQDGQELVALPWIVEYMRQDGGHGWKPMAAFDFETPAQNYANDCAKNNKTWEYRVVPAPIAPNAAQSDGEMVKDAARWNRLPAYLEKYQINYVGLKADIDADLAEIAASKKEE